MAIHNFQSRAAQALDLFLGDHSCSQAVFCTYADVLSLPEDMCKAIADPFSGGMRRGEACGAFTGALMVIGLFGKKLVDKEVKYKALNSLGVSFFFENLEKLNLHFHCKDLLGYDTLDPLQVEKFSFRKKETCPKIVETTIKILEDTLNYMEAISISQIF